MINKYSPYAIDFTAPVVWKPKEDYAAVSFIAIATWLVVDTGFAILRVFKRKKGLYFWSMTAGTVGCILEAVGNILKFLTPELPRRLWPIWTTCIILGWSLIAPAQLLVLNSRVHLVTEHRWLQRVLMWMSISTIITFVLPTWVADYHACNATNKKVSSTWSAREAIIERYTQIGFTICECIINGIYVYSLIILLRCKVFIRQKRVMYDLIYVNIICVLVDAMVVLFVYLNQRGLSRPIQVFSYALKFKLEFLVLNQLMAVAAYGIRKKTWGEKRYIRTDVVNGFSAECQAWADKPVNFSKPMTSSAQGTAEKENVAREKCIEREDSTELRLTTLSGSPRSSAGEQQTTKTDAVIADHMHRKISNHHPLNGPPTFFNEKQSLPALADTTHQNTQNPLEQTGDSGSTLSMAEKEFAVSDYTSQPVQHHGHTEVAQQYTEKSEKIKRRPYWPRWGRSGSLADPDNATPRRQDLGLYGGLDGDEDIDVSDWENSRGGGLTAPWFKGYRDRGKV